MGSLRSLGGKPKNPFIFFESDGSPSSTGPNDGGEPLIIYARKTNTDYLRLRRVAEVPFPRHVRRTRVACICTMQLIGGSWLRSTARRADGFASKIQIQTFFMEEK